MYGYCGGGYPEYEGGYEKNGNQSSTFVLIVVLFILLIIVGRSFLPY